MLRSIENQPFDPAASYLLREPHMTILGKRYQRGQIIPRGKIAERTLRQMYDQRSIGIVKAMGRRPGLPDITARMSQHMIDRAAYEYERAELMKLLADKGVVIANPKRVTKMEMVLKLVELLNEPAV